MRRRREAWTRQKEQHGRRPDSLGKSPHAELRDGEICPEMHMMAQRLCTCATCFQPVPVTTGLRGLLAKGRGRGVRWQLSF